MSQITIAIDGPGSAGKGTVARGVARALGYQYVDTGAMYRAVAYTSKKAGIPWNDEPKLTEFTKELEFQFTFDSDILQIIVNGQDRSRVIREPEIGIGASQVSKLPGVRAALLQLQRDLGARGGVVMDGRDIGTVVLPRAELKIYLDADLDVRALRRHQELVRRGTEASLSRVRAELDARDKQDMHRNIAPLKPADDAVILNTTHCTISAAIQSVLTLAVKRGAQKT